jgi:hypothetical protein
MLIEEDFLSDKKLYRKVVLPEVLTLLYVALTFTLGFAISQFVATRESAVYNSYRVVELENRLNVFCEKAIQEAFLSNCADFIVLAFNNFYLIAHIPCSVAFLLWVLHFRNEHYYLFRNSFLLSHTTCIIVQFLFPCAPPRTLIELGFVDTMLKYSKSDLMELEEATGVNPYAAMPSMHFSYAFLVGAWGYYLSNTTGRKIAFPVYTAIVSLGVIVTGNHFILDCAAALLINVLSFLIVSRWGDIKKMVQNDSVLAQENPNCWWLFIIIVFGGFTTIVHIITRVVFFIFVT